MFDADVEILAFFKKEKLLKSKTHLESQNQDQVKLGNQSNSLNQIWKVVSQQEYVSTASFTTPMPLLIPIVNLVTK